MNNRYFDHKMHAAGSARRLLSALKSAAVDTKNLTADELTENIIAGVIGMALEEQGLGEEKRSEFFEGLMDKINIKRRPKKEEFDSCVILLAEAFKGGNRNDYQFIWNMIKEAMYCIEEDSEETLGFKLSASTAAYHLSNNAKESVGAVGLKYASEQLVF